MPRPRTGQLYNVSLPVNFSGMEVSIIRLRAHSLWKNGLNLSSFEIPPRILPWPFTRRVDLVYQNLGKWSTFYYNVPNYTFVAPVIGYLAYDSNTNSTNHGIIELNISGDSFVIVRFQNLALEDGEDVGIMKCVRFGTDGRIEFTNLTLGSSCVAKLFKWQKLRKMERQSEKSEGLDTIWIGNSKMPTASGIRTLPSLENSYVP
ncbi:hypothetical protein DH2020_029674 [Rehmannia glutinosa]|uniref:Uncharacterized protein n=1 Tax=Rehmannia glutinosa TaxID=99300 RepID=A0ABR0VNT0_REHGL